MNDQTKWLEERINDDTTSPNKWNFWPDKAEIISYDFVVPETASPSEMYNVGYMMGSSNVSRQIRGDQLPQDLKLASLLRKSHGRSFPPDPRSDRMLWPTTFAYDGPKGQRDDYAGRNYWAIVQNGYRDEARFMLVLLGCKHSYQRTQISNCYYRGVCVKCGHTFEVDSSG